MVQVAELPRSRSQSFAGEIKPVALALGLAFGLTVGTMPAASAATLTVLNNNDTGAGSLRATVAGAAAGDSIVFGTVTGAITLTTGEILLDKNLTITGPGAATLAISGNNASRIFNIDGTTAPTIQISDLTLRNGNADPGGAIDFEIADGTLTLSNMAFTQNTATDSGGALWMACGACSITVTDSTFTGNTAGLYGGAIGTESGGALTITRTTISGNTSPAGRGGGIFMDDVVLLIDSSTISGNTSDTGGGIFLYADTNATIRNSTISGNTATSGNGGGVYFYNDGGSTLTIQNSTVAGNTGSGIFLYSDILNNLILASTIVANNTGSDVAGGGFAPRIAADNSLIRTPAAGTLITGSGNITGLDPLLGPLASNGGPTQTRALLGGSPAIDTGSNPAALAFDQRGAGFPRTFGAQTDIGAFEIQGAPPPPPVGVVGIPTLSQWGVALLSVLMAGWGMLTGFGRRRRK